MADFELDRDTDRFLRTPIDELTRQLTPLGKVELAARLLGEAAIDAFEVLTGPAVLTRQPKLPSGTRLAITAGDDVRQDGELAELAAHTENEEDTDG